MKNQVIGYIRVSTLDQSTQRQLEGLSLDRCFEDKASGKDTHRPALQQLIQYARDGDTVLVHSIDRLARNLVDLRFLITTLNAKNVTVQFVKENLTFEANNSNPMNTLMLNMMGAFAEFERALIKERQREGIAIAKAAGHATGRPARLTISQIKEIRERVGAGQSKAHLANEFKVSRATIYNVLRPAVKSDS